MGVLLPNFRRSVSATVNGRVVKSLETVAAVSGGTLLGITEGRQEGSKTDGSQYVVAHVQITPGTKIRVAGYGEEQIKAIRAIEQDKAGAFSAVLSPMGYGGFKLVEFDKTAEQAAQ